MDLPRGLMLGWPRMSAASPVVLLLDDAGTFKAVEGTCLRRHRCRLVKASVDGLADAAGDHHPAMVFASCSDASARERVLAACRAPALSRVPVLLLDLQGPATRSRGKAPAARGSSRRRGSIEVVSARSKRSGEPDWRSLDARLDAAILRIIPALRPRGPRLAAQVRVRCSGIAGMSLLHTKDISDTGLFLRTAAVVPAGKTFSVSLHLAPGIAVSGRCEVVRDVRPGAAGREAEEDLIEGIGVRFVELADPERETLRSYLAAGMRTEKRSTGRSVRLH